MPIGNSKFDALFAAADALYARSDAMERGKWGGVADAETGWKEYEHHRRPTGEFMRPPEDEELK